jgi:Lipocalin-like domain
LKGAVEIYRADRLKFSSGDKRKGTAEEYKQASLGMSVHFGLYTVDPAQGTISFQIDRASFPNWDDTTEVRTYEMTGDERTGKVPARPDGSIPPTVLRRIKSENSKGLRAIKVRWRCSGDGEGKTRSGPAPRSTSMPWPENGLKDKVVGFRLKRENVI